MGHEVTKMLAEMLSWLEVHSICNIYTELILLFLSKIGGSQAQGLNGMEWQQWSGRLCHQHGGKGKRGPASYFLSAVVWIKTFRPSLSPPLLPPRQREHPTLPY